MAIVKRILIYDGDDDWVEETLKLSFVSKQPFITSKGKIYEVVRDYLFLEKEDKTD